MATWAMRQRYAWIDARLAAGESFNRDDIVRAFTVTKQTASATVREYQALQPDALRYCQSRKAFVRADSAPLSAGITRREATLTDALKRLAIAARSTGGVAGADPKLMAACDQAERALSLAHTEPSQGEK